MKAVLISDVHYNLATLPVADSAMRQAVAKANELKVPLIVAGDLHDTKANLRGECVKAMIETFKLCEIKPMVLIGNHDLINEKSKEDSLWFLNEYVDVIRVPMEFRGFNFIPYQHDPKEFIRHLSAVPKGSILICHQGVQEADMGEYVQDKSAVPKSAFESIRAISGHYHRRQDIKCGSSGIFSYIGTPYTISFAEAHDGPKGVCILSDDGELLQSNISSRVHAVLELLWDNSDQSTANVLGSATTSNVPESANILWSATPANVPGPTTANVLGSATKYTASDIIWVKCMVAGLVGQITKAKVAERLGIPHLNFKLDIIRTKVEDAPVKKTQSNTEILDNLIEAHQSGNQQYLKNLWRSVYSEADKS